MTGIHHRPLEGRVALVTGAVGALGTAIVKDLGQQGAEVYGVDVVGEGVFRADLSTPAGNESAVAHVLEIAGRLDILVLNAGVQFVAAIGGFPQEEWKRLTDVMLNGPFAALSAAWPALTSRPGGRVIVTGSTTSYLAEPFKAAYVSAKHGVLGLVRVAALEGAAHQLTANLVAPGWMDTQMLRSQLEAQAETRGITVDEVIATLSAVQPGNRFIAVEEVAAAVCFLASPRASAINGVALPIDLGASVQA
ncbi:MAG: SDR family oxidoreductase [Solirubrobacteraceae bacterium]